MIGAPMNAKQRYDELASGRTSAIDRAKKCIKVTLPKLLVEVGSRTLANRTPYQGMGARCVNSLSSRLLLALLPPNASFFKLSPDDYTLKEIAEAAGAEQGEVEQGLARVERAVVNEVETTTMRPVFGEAMRHIVATGNLCVFLPEAGGAKLFPLTHFVAKRDPAGNLLEVITLAQVSESALSVGQQAAVAAAPSTGDKSAKRSKDGTVYDVYTRAAKVGDTWQVGQEIDGVAVPGTDGSYPSNALPFIVARWGYSPEDDYGTGLVHDHLGDFEALEGLRKAILKAAAAAAKILLFLNPNSAMRERDITEAESGRVLRGNPGDLTAFQLQKFQDLQFARLEAESITEQLSYVFGLRSSIQRNGERVTAEEIRYLAQELEDNLGGVYSILSQEFLLPLVSAVMARLQRQGRLPQLPKGLLKPRIVVGIAALGRGHDAEKMLTYLRSLREAMGEQFVIQRIRGDEAAARLGAALDVNTDGLIKSDDDVRAEQQEAMAMQAGVAAAPNIARAMTQGTP